MTQWQWQLRGGWRDYEAGQSATLEAAFSRGELSCSFTVGLAACTACRKHDAF